MTKSLLLLFLLAMLGCSAGQERLLDPEEVASDFSDGPEAAVIKYRKIWIAAEGSEVRPIDRVTIAGQLMKHDEKNYQGYYQFVLDILSSDDDYVAAAAANSLRNAKGGESEDILFELLDSPRSIVGRSAAHSIRYRFDTLKHSGDAGDEHLLMSRRIAEKCSSSQLKSYVRSVICSNN